MIGFELSLSRTVRPALATRSITAASRRVALVGNSLGEQIYSLTGSQDVRAFGTWLNILSMGRARVPRELVFARSGYTSAELEDQFAAAIASDAGTIVFYVTTNDCRTAAGTMAEVEARYRDWKARAAAAGKVQIWSDGQPRSDAPGGDYIPTRNVALRDLVRAIMDDPGKGCFVAPTFHALGTAADETVPAAGMLRSDNLHDSYQGAHAAARAILGVLDDLLPPFDALARPGIVREIDTGFTGGGPNIAPASGGAAGGSWSITVSPGISWDMATDAEGIRWIMFDVPAIVDASIMMIGPAHSALVGAGRTFVPGATRLAPSVLWRLAAGHANARMARCYLYDSGGKTLPYDIAAGTPAAAGSTTGPAIDASDEGSAGTMTLPPGAIAGLLDPWPGTLRANANRAMPLISWFGLAGEPATAQIAFAMPQIAVA